MPPREEWLNGYRSPSPPELAIAEQLSIEWSPASLDWLWFDENGHSPLKLLDNLVFIKGTESSLGAHPADSLIEHVGGQALIDGTIGSDDDSATVVLSLACYAADEPSAEIIEVETNAYLRSRQQYVEPSVQTSWMSYTGPMGFTVLRGKMRHARRALVFTGEFFHIADDFPALLAYLRARGCTDFRYEFAEKREP